MDRQKGNGPTGRRIVRTLCRAAGAVAAGWLLAVALGSAVRLSQPDDAADPHARAGGWGGEALEAVRGQALALAPLAVANACGIGASSCFKCHNGTRAKAPKMDKKATPWHPDHKTVNDSCVGCHSGNARLIKQDIAHTGLVKDPKTKVEACAVCHKTGNAPALANAYQTAAKGGK